MKPRHVAARTSKRYRLGVASIRRTGCTRHKKYAPSAEQRAEDERLRKEFDNLSHGDVKKFEQSLDRIFDSAKAARIRHRKRTGQR